MPREVLLWAFGFGRKSPAAIAEAERVAGVTLDEPNLQIPDYARETRDRLRARWASAPMPSLIFPATSVRAAAGGIAVRCQERGVQAKRIALEDHGLPGLAFMGADVMTVETLPTHLRWLDNIRPHLAADAELILLHCQVMADGGALGRALSRAVGCPVVGMDVDQVIGNRRYEGQAYRCTPERTVAIGSVDAAVMHFD